jgi:hypothetical protein
MSDHQVDQTMKSVESCKAIESTNRWPMVRCTRALQDSLWTSHKFWFCYNVWYIMYVVAKLIQVD